MRLSMNLSPVADKLGYECGIVECAKAGFDAMDMGFFTMKKGNSAFSGDDYREKCKDYLALAKENGIVMMSTDKTLYNTCGVLYSNGLVGTKEVSK